MRFVSDFSLGLDLFCAIVNGREKGAWIEDQGSCALFLPEVSLKLRYERSMAVLPSGTVMGRMFVSGMQHGTMDSDMILTACRNPLCGGCFGCRARRKLASSCGTGVFENLFFELCDTFLYYKTFCRHSNI